MEDIVIVSAARTAVGKFGGSLAKVPATELGSIALKAALASFDDAQATRPVPIAAGPTLKPGMSDAQTLKAMRVTVVVFTVCVLVYAISMQDSSIYEMVAGAYQVPLVGAFVPLVCGLYWKRATTQGAISAVTLGIGVWLIFMVTPALHQAFPQQLAGLLAAVVGMLAGSLLPQWVSNHHREIESFTEAKA